MTRRDFLLLSAASAFPMLGKSRFEALLDRALKDRWPTFPIGDIIVRVGKELLGTPYVGGTLDQTPEREVCVVKLDGLDCVTYFEACLAFARMLKHGGSTFADLTREVTFTRYRDGRIDGYLSRLHYTLDWMQNNEKKGTVARVALPSEVELAKPLNFMSTHPNSYAALKANPDLLPALKAIEATLTTLTYVPAAKLEAVDPLLRSGDIVGIVTDTPGLDYSHTGLIVRDANYACFMHASSVKKEVILDGPISSYVNGRKGALGATFVRPLEVR